MNASPNPFALLCVGIFAGLALTSRLLASDAVVNFSEIHYHPDSEATAEWIELHNQMSIRIDLSGWRLSAGIDYQFPEGTSLDPGAYLVVHGEGPAPIEHALGPFSGQLANEGETLRLRDRNDRIMAEIEYDDHAPWPDGPDGMGWTLAKRRPQLTPNAPDSWGTSRSYGGTPGMANTVVDPPGNLILSEVGAGWVELWNRGSQALSLSEIALHSQGTSPSELPVDQSLAPDERLAIETPSFRAGNVVFLTQGGRNRLDEAEILDIARYLEQPQARRADHLQWHFTEAVTPNAPSQIPQQDAVVINEIMYHFPPLYDQPGTVENEYTARDEEWIELTNRSDNSVDLTGWTLAGGIRFDFPDETTLAPDSFLVIARDAETLRAKYPDIVILGDFKGNLGNASEEVRLLDALGNPADEVAYFDSGRWPAYADGGGSSLELRDPWADNSNPEAWASSNEEDKAEWVELAYEGSGRSPVRSNDPSNFHEFLMGLVDAGEVLVDDVSVIEDPQGEAVELMKNGGFERTNVFSGAVTDWRMLGTHVASEVEKDPSGDGNHWLRLKADGAIEHTYNNVSSTFLGGHRLSDSQTYAIRLRAKWVNGVPLLNTRLYLNRLGRTHALPMPDQLGTPGRRNSRSVENLGPTFHGLEITPLAPAANESIRVRITVQDPQGIDRLTLHYRSAEGDWQSVPMISTGSKDRGEYTGQIPGQSGGTLLHFYLEASDRQGASAFFPSGGPDSRALLRVGTPRVGDRPVNHVRLLMLPEEHAAMRQAEHAVSNGRIGGTLIANDTDYHFDVGIRLRSSPYGRRSNRTGYNVVLGKEHPYRGVHDSISIDRGDVMPNGNSSGFLAVKAGAGVNELVVNQIAQRARGIPTTYEDVIYIETPTIGESSLAQVRMARYGNLYLNSQYEDGGQGATHKYELIYHPTTTVDGRSDGLKGPYVTVRGIDIQDMRDDKEAYRFNFIPTNNRDKDDFTGIIRMGAAFSSRTDNLRRERVPEAIDVDQWMRVFAFQSLIGMADTYNMGLEHNLVLYTRPSDGKVMAFPWDLDHSFYYSPTANLLGRGGTNLARIINLPEYRRLFYGHLNDIINTAYDVDVLGPWIAHLNEVTENNYNQRFLNYIQARSNHVSAELKQVVSAPFQITSNRGNDFETDQPVVLLEGTGWVDVRHIRNEATGEYLELTWIDVDRWQTEIPLRQGENAITLQAVDFQGRDIGTFFTPGSDRITINATGGVEAAAAGNLVLSEIHYHPAEGAEGTEFIELQNAGAFPVDLTGIRFTRGVTVQFLEEAATLLDPGATALFVENLEAFTAQYGDQAALSVLGTFSGSRLSNGGETLELVDRSGVPIVEMRYGDQAPWVAETDGGGPSLVYRQGDPSDPFAWRASVDPGGSPGTDERVLIQEGEDVWEYAFGDATAPLQAPSAGTMSLRYHTLADELVWQLQASPDLHTWEALDPTALTWQERASTPTHTVLTFDPPADYAFLRVQWTLKP